MKRILNIVCGIGVLYTGIAHVHILHHLFTMHGQDLAHPVFLLSVVLAAIADVLCLVGGVLLLLSAR